MVQKVAKSNASILIEGETGTGKELIAGSVHYNSDRKDKNFVKVNCAALQDTLLESELFGHEKGAFTGADKQRIGRFEQANFGTIFLDEISDMSSSTQAKVLRVLQEQEFERLGGTKTIKVDVRILSATNKDLRKEIEGKRFRDDLFYRLNVVTIFIPPLRERREDILPLAHYFLRRFSGELSKKVAGFTLLSENKLTDYPWPGNIRELRNTIERAFLLTEDSQIQEEDLVLVWSGRPPGSSKKIRLDESHISSEPISLTDFEKRMVLEALEKANWVQKEAASYLGISRRVMHYKIQKFGIRNPSWVKNR
jgi:transcriptional regulator with GAF, ATPase, and Fis domain